MILKESELYAMDGGAIHWGVVGVIGAIGVFIVGVVDGLLRPLRCN